MPLWVHARDRNETLMAISQDEFERLRQRAGTGDAEAVAVLEPYRVDNAIIMAAGLSSRFAPISYETPKGLLVVRGEVLIERQIRQLREAGITDITVVVGYQKERFAYLADAFGVDIVVNDLYAQRNNNYTLWLVRDRLANTYVCSSDDYFERNPFERFVRGAYYAAQYVVGPTEEWCLQTDADDHITGVEVGGADAWVMLGHAYFDRAFSRAFVGILEAEVEDPTTADRLWESLYADHLGELPMDIRRYDQGVIHEFDSLDELTTYDPAFIETVDSTVLDNITDILHCARTDLSDFYPITKGLTNLSFHVAVGDDEYVYRHPGVGTDKFINRRAEADAEAVAARMGVDGTFVYEDVQDGWKISHFVRNARTIDPTDPADVRRAMECARSFHESGATIPASFDFFADGRGYEHLLEEHGDITADGYFELRDKVVRVHELSQADGYGVVFSHNDPTDPADVRRAMECARSFHESGATIPASFDFFADGRGYEHLLEEHGDITADGYFELRDKVVRVHELSQADGYGVVFSHNDYLPLNLLVGEDGALSVIDWEFAGMGDPGNDTATFIICSDADRAQGDAAIDAYFGRPATFEERRHFWSRVVLGGWCWYVWALEKEAEGAGVGAWLGIYRSYCVDYIDMVLAWYEDATEGALA